MGTAFGIGCGARTDLFNGWISWMNGNHKDDAKDDGHQCSGEVVNQRVGTDFTT